MMELAYLWSGHFPRRLHISTRKYARIVREWVLSDQFELIFARTVRLPPIVFDVLGRVPEFVPSAVSCDLSQFKPSEM